MCVTVTADSDCVFVRCHILKYTWSKAPARTGGITREPPTATGVGAETTIAARLDRVTASLGTWDEREETRVCLGSGFFPEGIVLI